MDKITEAVQAVQDAQSNLEDVVTQVYAVGTKASAKGPRGQMHGVVESVEGLSVTLTLDSGKTVTRNYTSVTLD